MSHAVTASNDTTAAPPDPFGRPDARHVLRHGAQVVLADTLIAAVLAALGGGHFGRKFLYAQAIGVIIWLIVEFGRLALPRARLDAWPSGWRGVALVAVACAVGYLAGTAIVDALLGVSTWDDRRPVRTRPGWTSASPPSSAPSSPAGSTCAAASPRTARTRRRPSTPPRSRG
jgi:hypothetical protein